MSCCKDQGHGKDGELAGRAIRRAPASGEVVNRGCCGGRDLGPVEDHEGPSESDIAKFDDVTSKCPECGVELYDDVAVCWKCGHAVSASTQSGSGVPAWAVVVAVIAGGAMLWWGIGGL